MGSRDREIDRLRADVAALTARVQQLEAAAGLLSPPPVEGPAAAGDVPLTIAPPSRTIGESADAERAAAARDRESLEARIGSHWLNRLGIVAVLVGLSYFLRYAFENDWIGPTGQVAAGIACGIGAVLWSERFRNRGYLAFSWSLKAIGIGALYLSIWAAFQLYALVPAQAAFAAMALVTASAATLALRQDAQVLALFATAGGFATPVLLSTGENRALELFLYVTLLNAGVLAMVRQRAWTALLAAAFLGTVSLYVGWHITFHAPASRAVALTFATIFFAMFAAAPLLARTPGTGKGPAPGHAAAAFGELVLLLLPLANGAVYFLQIVALLEPLSADVAPVAAILLAAFHLGLAPLVGGVPGAGGARRSLGLMNAGVALSFVTIAIPLKLDAHGMTFGWLTEAGVLLWIGWRTQAPVVMKFGVAALGLAILRLLLLDNFDTRLAILNTRFIAFALAIALLGTIAGIGRRTAAAGPRVLALTTATLNVLALVALSREVEAYFAPARWDDFYPRAAAATTARDFAYSAVWMVHGALVMLAGFWLRWALLRWQALLIVGLTIGKVFLYDLSNLDQAYRIVSVIALGLLLLSISFAYQRDWLRLRSGGGDPRQAPSA